MTLYTPPRLLHTLHTVYGGGGGGGYLYALWFHILRARQCPIASSLLAVSVCASAREGAAGAAGAMPYASRVSTLLCAQVQERAVRRRRHYPGTRAGLSGDK